MWKKFLATTAILATLGTNLVAFAAVPPSVANMNVSHGTFNPANGEIAQVTWDLVGDSTANVYAYVDGNGILPVVIEQSVTPVHPDTGITYTFYGKIGNIPAGNVLATGDYTMHIELYDPVTLLQIGAGVTKPVVVTNKPVVVAGAPVVSNFTADPVTFSPAGNESSEISFNVDKDAYVKVQIQRGPNAVKTFAGYDGTKYYASTVSHSILWDGKDSKGVALPVDLYTVYVSVKTDVGAAENTYTIPVNVVAADVVNGGTINDLTLDPSTTWDPAKDGELKIDFELTSKAQYLTIEAKSGSKVVEILNDQSADDGDYKEVWDGTDEDGDFVKPGTWTITVRADGSVATRSVTLAYSQPSVKNTLITKSSFDPAQYEKTTLLFKVDTSSVVTVDAYKGTKKEVNLVDSETVKKNKWYSVSFDGYDKNGDEVDYGNDWKFKITAKNPTDDKVLGTSYVEFNVAEDTAGSKATNITADSAIPAALEKGNGRSFGYTLDSDGEVYLAVYEGSTAGGKAKAELLDYAKQTAGYNEVFWNGLDTNNKVLKDGTYSYKLISKSASGNSKDTEIGTFVIGNTAYFGGDVVPEPTPLPVVDCTVYYKDPSCMPPVPTPAPTPVVEPTAPTCGETYSDMVDNSSELCEALSWVSENGIFTGYADGSFKPYKKINRAEVLKVVLNAFNVNLLPANGSDLGFKDVDASAWYMSFARTAQFYGMLEGYNNGTEAKLENNVTRVELLKFVLEADKQFTGYEFTNGYYYPPVDYSKCDYMSGMGCGYSDNTEASWFYEYANAAFNYDLYSTQTAVDGKVYLHPSQEVERGEVAMLLYRMHKAGLMEAK